MVFPEWWGLTDYLELRTKQLAELGYVAMAVDMYGEGKIASDPAEAGSLMNGVLSKMEDGEARVLAAMDFLKSQPEVDANRLGAIGYCFGGAIVLHAARKVGHFGQSQASMVLWEPIIRQNQEMFIQKFWFVTGKRMQW